MSEEENRSIIRNTWMSIAMTLSIAGNVLLVAVISRNNRFHNVTNAYNLTLSVSDLVKVFSFIPIYLVYADLKTWPFGVAGCYIFTLIFFSSFGVSVLTLMCLSFERYHLIVKPSKKQMTVRQANYIILATWIISFIISCLTLPFLKVTTSKKGTRCSLEASTNWNIAIITTMAIFSQGIPSVFFLVTHILTVKKLKRDANAVEPRDQCLAARNRVRRNTRAIKILVIEAVSWVLLLCPYYVFNFISISESGGSVQPFSWRYLVMNCALVLQTAVNPALHFIFIQEFRNELRVLWNSILKKLQVNQVEPSQNREELTTELPG